MRETTNLCIEMMNSKRQVKGETWSRGTNSRLPFDVNVMLILSIVGRRPLMSNDENTLVRIIPIYEDSRDMKCVIQYL